MNISRKALISLILSLIGIILISSSFLLSSYIPVLNFLIFILAGILGLLGLIAGLKSIKNPMGMAGLIISIIILLVWLYGFINVYAFFFGNL